MCDVPLREYACRNSGVMLARDIEFSAAQALYERFARLTEEGNVITIDPAVVDARPTLAPKDNIYVSIVKGKRPILCEGGEISLYEEKENHNNYKIVRDGSPIIKITVSDE